MKIALVAMSGVRACDADLMAMGLTLPGFVERSQVIASLPSLGLLTLAAMTPKQHECCYIEVNDIDELAAAPGGFDLVALTSFTAQIPQTYELADRWRAAGLRVVLGGLHVSVCPDEAQEHADAVVIGEGEITWLDLLADAERDQLRKQYRAARQYDLAHAPIPAFEMLDVDRYNRLTVQASRGCPWRCDFCAASILIAPVYRQKPVEKVLEEVDRIRALWQHPFIEFADDNAFVHRRYWKRLLPELATRQIRWFAETDLSIHEDEELLSLMRKAGCTELLIGLESPTESGLRGIEQRNDMKRRWWPDYQNAVRRIQSQGIRVNGCFVLGLDGHGPDIFDKVYDFAAELELFDVQITIQTPFPGTPLESRLRREGRLLYDGRWERCTLFDVNYEPRGMSAQELRLGFRDLAKRLYSEEMTNWRRDNFHARYLR